MPHPFAFVACLSVLTILVVVRVYLNLVARKRCSALLPPGNYLTWKPSNNAIPLILPDASTPSPRPAHIVDVATFWHPPLDGNEAQKEPYFWSTITAAALADGALQGLPIIHAVGQIDPSVLSAIEASTANHVHSFASVHSYVQEHFLAAPISSADGWFERLTGYVAEQKAASALEAAGHHVTFASTATNPVWDLLVDGHPVQVKEGLAGVKQFLLEHHGIDVVTSTENASAVKDASVHGIKGLSSEAIHGLTHRSVDGVEHAFDPGFHIPWVTLAFTAYRQSKFLFEERIKLSTAAARVARDVTGVAAGSYVGGKTGALMGSLLGPVGTAVGGFLGAVGGAIAGKMASTSIQNSPFKRAKLAYEYTADQARLQVDQAMEHSRTAVMDLQHSYECRFLAARAKIQESAIAYIRQQSREYSEGFISFAELFPAYLAQLIAMLDEQEQAVLATIPSSGFLAYMLPAPRDHIRAAIRSWFRNARKILKHEAVSFQKIEPRTVQTLRAEIERFLHQYTFELASLNQHIRNLVEDFEARQYAAIKVQEEAGRRVQQERDVLIRRFGSEVEDLHAKLVALIEHWNSELYASMNVLKNEGRAIGIDL